MAVDWLKMDNNLVFGKIETIARATSSFTAVCLVFAVSRH